MNIYYYISKDEEAPSWRWGIYTLLSYYISNNPNKNISIHEFSEIEDFYKIENEVESFVLISIPFFEEIWKIDSILKILRKKIPNIVDKKYQILLGGASIPQIIPESIFKYFPEIDYIINGKGEAITEKIINGEIRKKGVYNGDEFEFKTYPLHSFFVNKLKNVNLPIFMDGLKCPWGKCKFCLHSENDHIHRSSKEVFELLKWHYIKDNKKDFYMCDNWLNLGKMYRVFDMLLAEGMNDVTFEFFGAHIKNNYKELGKYIPKFNSNFIRKVSWGVEYIDDEVLSLYEKGITVNNIFEHAKIINEIGLNLNVYILLGLPGIKQKNIDTMYNNISLYDKYVNKYQISTFTLDSNIDVFKNPEKFGIKIGSRTPLNFQYNSINPLLSTIYSYEVFDYENQKFISQEENIKRFQGIYNVMHEKNEVFFQKLKK